MCAARQNSWSRATVHGVLNVHFGRVEPLTALPVYDRPIATVIAVLADEKEEFNDCGREPMIDRFRGLFPDLRSRELPLARVGAWLGWRAISEVPSRASDGG